VPLRRTFEHKIELEDGTTPPFVPIYSLSEVEQLTLREFLDKNLANHFIRPSQSSARAPNLFIRMKDGSLRAAVDYRGLNLTTKKDWYPLPLVLYSFVQPTSSPKSTSGVLTTSSESLKATDRRLHFAHYMGLTSFKSCIIGWQTPALRSFKDLLGMCYCLPIWRTNLLRKIHLSARNTFAKSAPPPWEQSVREMRVQRRHQRLPQIRHWPWRHPNGRIEGQNYPRLANPTTSQGRPILLRACWPLPAI